MSVKPEGLLGDIKTANVSLGNEEHQERYFHLG